MCGAGKRDRRRPADGKESAGGEEAPWSVMSRVLGHWHGGRRAGEGAKRTGQQAAAIGKNGGRRGLGTACFGYGLQSGQLDVGCARFAAGLFILFGLASILCTSEFR